jgi:hypothetical protein
VEDQAGEREEAGAGQAVTSADALFMTSGWSRMEGVRAAKITLPDATAFRGIRTRGVVHCALCAPIVLPRMPHCDSCGRIANNLESLGQRHAGCAAGAKFIARDAMADDVEPLRDSIKAHAHGRKTAECDLCGEMVRWVD